MPYRQTPLSLSNAVDLTSPKTLADKLNKWIPELSWRSVGQKDGSDRFDLCGADLPTGEWVQARWNAWDKMFTVLIFPPNAPKGSRPVAGTKDVDARACVVDALAQYQGSEVVLSRLYEKVPGVIQFIKVKTWVMMSMGAICLAITTWHAFVLFQESAFLKLLFNCMAVCVSALLAIMPILSANSKRTRQLATARISFNRIVLASAGAKTVDDIPQPVQVGALSLVDEEKAERLARMLELAEAGGIASDPIKPTVTAEATPGIYEDPWPPETRQAAVDLGRQMRSDPKQLVVKPLPPRPMMPSGGTIGKY